jgi:hypothetical protein
MHAREKKVTLEDAALTKEARITINAQEWQTEFPPALERLSAPVKELRPPAVRSFSTFFASTFVDDLIDPYLRDLTTSLLAIVSDPFSPSEHDDALSLLCLLCLQRFSSFDPYARVVISELLPGMDSLNANDIAQFFAVSFLASFGLSSIDSQLPVLTRILSLLRNKKVHAVELSGRMIAELTRGLNVMLAVLPPTVCGSQLYEQIAPVVDVLLGSSKRKVLFSALDTLAIVYESLVAVERLLEDGEPVDVPMTVVQFTGDYANKFRKLPSQLAKKADQRAVQERCDELRALFDGAENSEEIVLNSQVVTVVGERKRTAVDAFRRVAGAYFQQTMTDNAHVHRFLGVVLLARRVALRLKKGQKAVIEADRAMSKRAKEQMIAKDRKKKEKRVEGDDELE